MFFLPYDEILDGWCVCVAPKCFNGDTFGVTSGLAPQLKLQICSHHILHDNLLCDYSVPPADRAQVRRTHTCGCKKQLRCLLMISSIIS